MVTLITGHKGADFECRKFFVMMAEAPPGEYKVAKVEHRPM